MNHPKGIIYSHPQLKPNSCAAWVLKLFCRHSEKSMPSPSIQSETPDCNFVREIRDRLKDEFKIETTTIHFGTDFGELERIALEEIANGAVILVILPSDIRPARNRRIDISTHTYVIFEERGHLFYGTRSSSNRSDIYTSQKFDWSRCI